MSAKILKQEALESIKRLPEDADIDEIMYQLSVINKVHKSREAIRLGQVISQNNLEQEMEQW